MSTTDWVGKDPSSLPRIELMDNYMGTEIDKTVAAFSKAFSSKDPQDLEIALHQILMWKETKTCDYCGKHKKKMYDCNRCKGAGYCGEGCQRAAWPTHKKVCKDLKKSLQDQPVEKQTMKAKMYNPQKALKYRERGICMFTEACGVGVLRILWHPMDENVANVVTFKSMKNDTIFKTETCGVQGGLSGQSADLSTLMVDADNIKTFNNELSNLDPIARLCLACGPLPDLEIAKRTLDDALLQAQGSVPNLKMHWVGFTPLEWAAKKGHLEIVKWLVSDARTTSLVNVGTPVGWACYAGRVEVARFLVSHGASPDATHEAFWDKRPPLLAAAENGQLDAVKFLVGDCGVRISVKWKGNDIKKHVQMSPLWNELSGHKKVMKYAKSHTA